MLSVEEIAKEVSDIKLTSEQISAMVDSSSINLSKQKNEIANIVRGSKSGEDAVKALSVAIRSLTEAVSSMRALDRTCDNCIQNLIK